MHRYARQGYSIAISMATAFTTLYAVPHVDAQEYIPAEKEASTSSRSSTQTIPLPSGDGLYRSEEVLSSGEIHGRKINLAQGDTLQLSADSQEVAIINGSGKAVGLFSLPTLLDHDQPIAAHFAINDDGGTIYLVLVADDGSDTERSCGKATAGKWAYRGLSGLVCTAFGAGTALVGGLACGLAADGVEDLIPFDRVC